MGPGGRGSFGAYLVVNADRHRKRPRDARRGLDHRPTTTVGRARCRHTRALDFGPQCAWKKSVAGVYKGPQHSGPAAEGRRKPRGWPKRAHPGVACRRDSASDAKSTAVRRHSALVARGADCVIRQHGKQRPPVRRSVGDDAARVAETKEISDGGPGISVAEQTQWSLQTECNELSVRGDPAPLRTQQGNCRARCRAMRCDAHHQFVGTYEKVIARSSRTMRRGRSSSIALPMSM